jgi:hypothetical protein
MTGFKLKKCTKKEVKSSTPVTHMLGLLKIQNVHEKVRQIRMM